MTFIKSLRRRKNAAKRGQAALEYFIIFAIVTLATLLSCSALFPRVQAALQGSGARPGFFQEAVLGGLDVDNSGR